MLNTKLTTGSAPLKSELKTCPSTNSASRIKIVHVTTIDMSVKFLLLPLLLHLKSAGYDVVTACASGPWRGEIESSGIPMQPVSLTRRISPFQDLVALRQLCSFFIRERPTIVHTHTPKANLLGRLAARMADVPIVVGMEHGFYFCNMSGLARAFHVQLSRLGALLSDTTLVINQEDYHTALREGIVNRSKLVYQVGGLGVDLQRFNPAIDGTAVRSSLGIPSDALVTGFIGRLTPEKGCREFVEAAASVQREIENSHFLVIGPSEGGTEGDLERLARTFQLNGRLHFLGTRTDTPQCYAAMDLFVLPSHREGLGIVLQEAAAMGKPAVTTDVRGCREVVAAGETGLLVPSGNCARLAEAMLHLLSNAGMREQMGRAARQRAERLFDQQRGVEATEALYQRLLREKGLN